MFNETSIHCRLKRYATKTLSHSIRYLGSHVYRTTQLEWHTPIAHAHLSINRHELDFQKACLPLSSAVDLYGFRAFLITIIYFLFFKSIIWMNLNVIKHIFNLFGVCYLLVVPLGPSSSSSRLICDPWRNIGSRLVPSVQLLATRTLERLALRRMVLPGTARGLFRAQTCALPWLRDQPMNESDLLIRSQAPHPWKLWYLRETVIHM